ncbi:DUF4124 domain-containing protein [Shewanella sp. VB17]|uniref:DUF4124 domain-containing protein n=1 Tax=Shewanella sp. VB17 TaxID=2739432 RepID=UPI001563E109|nr:DUF4124 domain-containing protein [Shewanella sp. VB17]NRD71681.1 DUF4124 domain-containing protein [Shewanella sp. VB17]
MRFSTIILLLTFTMMSHATVYKWIDKDGKIHYSDKPIPNSKTVQFKDNTQNQITLQLPVANSAETTEHNISTDYKLSITSPREEETIRNNEGNITIIAIISPDLAPKHVLVLLMDGIIVGPAQNTPIFNLKNVNRGEHSFIIKAIAQNGKQLASTPPRKVYLHRTRVNYPKSVTPSNTGSQ